LIDAQACCHQCAQYSHESEASCCYHDEGDRSCAPTERVLPLAPRLPSASKALRHTRGSELWPWPVLNCSVSYYKIYHMQLLTSGLSPCQSYSHIVPRAYYKLQSCSHNELCRTSDGRGSPLRSCHMLQLIFTHLRSLIQPHLPSTWNISMAAEAAYVRPYFPFGRQAMTIL
jgi:hypothetical protein